MARLSSSTVATHESSEPERVAMALAAACAPVIAWSAALLST